MRVPSYKPWLGESDHENVMFVCVHGYGHDGRDDEATPTGWFYPGSGKSQDITSPKLQSEDPHTESKPPVSEENKKTNEEEEEEEKEGVGLMIDEAEGSNEEKEEHSVGFDQDAQSSDEECDGDYVPEKDQGIMNEENDGSDTTPTIQSLLKKVNSFSVMAEGESEGKESLIKNVGIDMPEKDEIPGGYRKKWRDYFRVDILPKLVDFNPDFILISAGFDAHKKDEINGGYVALNEHDYEWVTRQIVQVANRCCNGRVVSSLEGGYRIHGGIISAFSRSVRGHVRGLVDGGVQTQYLWDPTISLKESKIEERLLEEKEKKRQEKIQKQRKEVIYDLLSI